MFRPKDSFFIALLIFITFLNGIDFYNDMQEEGHNQLHLALEALIILVSLSGVSYLIREVRQRRREIEALTKQLKITHADLSATRETLDETRASLSELDNKRIQASRQYGEVIQEQLEAWDFTTSEKEVALLLLKGLSFDEIANVRDTKEKTVRQQATAIYRKSGLNGRHEFAAWFFEDFLS
ncbi:LuxR C-terminal-related transcriptional regulator [Candidatus Thiothrix sp. Deng01]|uniref:LuxR C-terminal-related transcriptional regulator n=1 Tax=Candidatus Thiothrix phosphatis TaxID=3112415 RepID=A0ABU6CW20_9GAMM|nr:LuxR C-terminal-related transcriptional regulator [Candidatus Thiothrix sp. Deng01]MEB4591016.1 LuxR C-terminal-related transcriptional regulator [Candidatus Thiothrix sp. Deng01]